MRKSNRVISHCRICGNTLRTLMRLGNHTVSGFLSTPTVTATLPLTIGICPVEADGCGLVQLIGDTASPDSLYTTYWYRSGINTTMRSELNKIAILSIKLVRLKPGDIVLDIGANDGTLLSYYPKKYTAIGFEPAKNITRSKSGTATIIPSYFSAAPFLRTTHGKRAKIVTTIAMFYDLPRPHEFVRDLASCLAPDGVWINQMASLADMIEFSMFDNICHEHLEYYSLASLERLLVPHDLRVVDIETNTINGGSMRAYITHTAHAQAFHRRGARARIEAYRRREKRLRLTDMATYRVFAARTHRIKRSVINYLRMQKKQGKNIYGYGASTKGNTLLQYFGITTSLIAAIADRNPEKWGLFTAGTNIPIVPEGTLRKQNPDIVLVLPWHFQNEFIKREKLYLHRGGTLIFPLPIPKRIMQIQGQLREKKL